MRFALLAFSIAFHAPTAHAQAVLKPGMVDCVQTSLSQRTPLGQCARNAMAACEFHEEASPAALECFDKARMEWGTAVTDLIEAYAPDDARTKDVARIEAKYTLLHNLSNCDRQRELNLIGREEAPADAVTHVSCQALAASVTYVELLLRTGTVTPPQ